MYKVQPPCNFGEILTEVAHRTSRMLNISNNTERPTTCDIQKIEQFNKDVQSKDINIISRSLLTISNGEKYIATINKINELLEEFLRLPATFCSTERSTCKKKLRLISVQCKRAISNEISSKPCPSKLKSQLLTASGI